MSNAANPVQASNAANQAQPDEKHNKRLVLILIIAAILLILVPLFMLKGAEFSGSDDAGSTMVEEVSPGYTRWFTPVLEQLIGGELPSEMESLFFCIQTGIGVGIIAYAFGYLVARKKFATPRQIEGDEGLGLDEEDQKVAKAKS